MSDINSWDTTDASNNATPPDGFPENMAYSAVNNAARAMMGGLKRFFADLNGSLAGGGSADAYTVTLNAGYSAMFEGMIFAMSIPADNTGGACTLNVNSIGAQSVVDKAGNNPAAGSLQSGGIYTFIYDGTNFQVEGSLPDDLDVANDLDVGNDLTVDNDLAVAGQTSLEGFDEDAAEYTIGSGTIDLDVSLATYFYPSGNFGTNTPTFTFSNPAASGRVSSFTMELLGADDATITWPASVDWANGGSEPAWTAGVDVVAFVTRDGGTTWLGFLGGLDLS